jgi:hypothetical protein
MEEMCLLAMGFGKAEVGGGRIRLELLWLVAEGV